MIFACDKMHTAVEPVYFPRFSQECIDSQPIGFGLQNKPANCQLLTANGFLHWCIYG
jgi:hypothetical protein